MAPAFVTQDTSERIALTLFASFLCKKFFQLLELYWEALKFIWVE